MAPPLGPGGARIQFTYKLKLNERVQPRYNPEKDDMVDGLREHSGLPGNCISSDTPGMLGERIGDLA
jgi:hypothetical protein